MFKYLLDEARQAEYHSHWDPNDDYRNVTVTGWVLLVMYYDAKHWLLAQVCRVKDHDMECDDWGGPESGGMAGHCKRCGWGFSHTLY